MDSEMVNFNNFLRDMNSLCYFDAFVKSEKLRKGTKSTIKSRVRRRFNPLLDLTDLQFKKSYRFSKDNMRKIIDLVKDDLETDYMHAKKPNQVPVKYQIMAAIRFWGRSEHPEVTAKTHCVQLPTLYKICRRVASAFASTASRYIRMPVTLAEKERVTDAFCLLAKMPKVIGAVGYIDLKVKRDTLKRQTLKNINGGESCVHIQIVSDASLKIRDVDCKLQSQDEDDSRTHIFGQTKIKERFEQNEFRGRVLLGDDSLQNTPYILTPLPFPATEEDQSFNLSHSNAIAPVTQCLDLLKQRFPILNSIFCTSYGAVRPTILALALLHNMAVEWNDQSLNAI